MVNQYCEKCVNGGLCLLSQALKKELKNLNETLKYQVSKGQINRKTGLYIQETTNNLLGAEQQILYMKRKEYRNNEITNLLKEV